MVFIVFMSLAFYLLWTTICILLALPWLDRKEIVTAAYVVPAKTPALGVPLSAVMFVGVDRVTQSKIQVPVVIYQGLQIACGSVLTLVLRRWTENGRAAKASKDVEKASQDIAPSDGCS
ncbi:MAG: hypothetical protein LQ347_003749 [Umbilicaria vellea]|nr:MAG: hypothetical protein LQ347_003749 [Umbilicaria vellea]